jgi:DNA-3-methyladenine glycosylase I
MASKKQAMSVEVKDLGADDRQWAKTLLAQKWGTPQVVVHGAVFCPAELDGFVAWFDAKRVGLLTFNVSYNGLEIVTLNSMKEGLGVGSALVDKACERARQAECSRVWLITTNDNLDAVGFYQKRGFELVAVHRHAVEVSRKLKPEIPLTGNNGIPIRDEVEMEMELREAEDDG